VDKKQSKLVVQAFELYAQNNSTFEDIADFLAKYGITTSGSRPLKRDQVGYMLGNPFYYGLFRYAGELYEGKHAPIISKQLWDKVQAVLKSRSRPKKSKFNPMPLCSLLYCGECGRQITAESHTKKSGLVFTYYRCTKRNTNCSQPYISETELVKQLDELLVQYHLPQEWADGLLRLAQKDCQEATSTTSGFVQELRSKILDMESKLSRLLDVYLAQDIEQRHYREEKAKLLSEKRSLSEQIARFERTTNVWFEPYQKWVNEALNTEKIAISPALQPKKLQLQKIFGSNLQLQDQKIISTPQNQWAALRAAHKNCSDSELSCVLARHLQIGSNKICQSLRWLNFLDNQ
jgi:hypothetical protein